MFQRNRDDIAVVNLLRPRVAGDVEPDPMEEGDVLIRQGRGVGAQEKVVDLAVGVHDAIADPMR